MCAAVCFEQAACFFTIFLLLSKFPSVLLDSVLHFFLWCILRKIHHVKINRSSYYHKIFLTFKREKYHEIGYGTSESNTRMLKKFLISEPDLNQKTILITGGTGSFGQAFVETIARDYHPKKIIIFSRDEMKQYEMSQRLQHSQYKCTRYFIGDVRDLSRLEMVFSGVDIVIHAAALKHVHIAEYNPYECMHTNVIGTENVVRAALKNNVKQVLTLSTDKAVSPLSLYGASKLASEKVIVAANNIKGINSTLFSVVRYGNVIGSRGSVVPLFQRLLKEGSASLPITDMEMTRFSITLSQAVQFVLSCLGLMQGGEVFIPKIPSVRIVDLARALAPYTDIKVVGMRPGEKIHECMMTLDESKKALDMKDRYILLPPFMSRDMWLTHCTYRGVCILKTPMNYTSDSNVEWLSRQDMRYLFDDGQKTAPELEPEVSNI